ncbi:MAG TPA: hypothetical protein VF070_09920 [Streptosporangiaceae bacterium]
MAGKVLPALPAARSWFARRRGARDDDGGIDACRGLARAQGGTVPGAAVRDDHAPEPLRAMAGPVAALLRERGNVASRAVIAVLLGSGVL